MTGAQRSYLKTLCEEAKVPFDDKLTKAQASKRIDELQKATGAARGRAVDDASDAHPGSFASTTKKQLVTQLRGRPRECCL